MGCATSQLTVVDAIKYCQEKYNLLKNCKSKCAKQKNTKILIKGLMDSNFKMAFSSSKINGSIVLYRFHFMEAIIFFLYKVIFEILFSSNKMNSCLKKLILNFFLLEQGGGKKMKQCIALHSTSKKEWCGAAPVWSSVTLLGMYEVI